MVSHPLRSRSDGFVPENQPCFCLCLGFSQITMMRPLRLMILHFSQMGFTLGLTFMVVLLSLPIVENLFLKERCSFILLALAAPGDAPAGQIVQRELHGDLVTRQDPNEIHSKLPRNRCEYLVTVLELYLEHSVREGIRNDTFYFNNVLF